jgi:UDP-glucuronate 4-epimerase
MKILITGTAGFIGYHLVSKLLLEGHEILGIDSINKYYDTKLKRDRLKQLGIRTTKLNYNEVNPSIKFLNFKFIKVDLVDEKSIYNIFRDGKFDLVCHLAAQAGVRHSIENPRVYIESNLIGFFNIIENCRIFKIKHLVYASSSSVYGNSSNKIFSENDSVDNPISLYAATKKCNELIAHTYSHIFGMNTTGLRFFTVYGPWGRPDMAYFTFVKNILTGQPINVYAKGEIKRDFTYIDDVIQGILKIIKGHNKSTYNIYNIGRGNPISVNDFIRTIEISLGRKAIVNYKPMQPGDVELTYADTTQITEDHDYSPRIDLEDGIERFILWYKKYFKI